MKTLLKTRPTQRLFAASLLALFAVLLFPTLAVAQTPPGKVVIIRVDPIDNAGMIAGYSLRFNKPSGTVTDYQIQRSITGGDNADFPDTSGTDPFLNTGPLPGDLVSYQDFSGVDQPPQAYYYRVRARNMTVAGEWSDTSVTHAEPTITSVIATPSAPAEGAMVTLTSVADDVDTDNAEITYRWTQTAPTSGFGSNIALSSPTAANPTFTVPPLVADTELVFALVVMTNNQDSQPTIVMIQATGANDAPTANAGIARNVDVGATITLDGGASTDADTVAGDLIFAWTLINPPMVTVDGVSLTLATPMLNTNPVTLATTYTAAGAPATTEDPTNIDLPSGTVLTFMLVVSDDATPANTDMTTIEITIGGGASEEQVAAIVSEVARAIVSATVSAVTSRISNVASGVAGTQVAGLNIGGLSLNDSNMASALQTNVQAFATNSDVMKTLLGNSDFSLPLNAVGNGGSGFGSVGIWASGEYSDLSGESDDLDWDGELTGFHLGIDGKIRTSGDKNILIGVALSSLNGDLDYENNADTAAEKGNYEIDMTTVSPYIGWRAGVVDLWASVGFGEGEVELTDDADMKSTSDAEQTSFAIGGSVADMVVNKNYSVKLKGELSASEFDIDESEEGGITEQTVDATRARISVEASRISDLENGRAFEKSAEIGARFDGGDGETGAGVEIGGKLKYHAANGFTAEGSARVLLGHSGDYQEWGIQGTIRKQVRRDGQGLAFHLTPAYGNVNSSVSQLLAQGFTDDANNTANPDYHMNLTTRLGYGIAYRGMVTPYTEMVLGTSDEYRMGINWKPNQTFNLTLLGKQSNQNTIRLQGAINF